jgi:hypothetical protein
VSRWDASGVFFEIREGVRGVPGASPRTLVLLYATDLAFRLRWEIRPALEAGMTVIAAPYIETAVAFGRSAGLPKPWLKELFAFAPEPECIYRVAEGRIPAALKPEPTDSFLEFSFTQLRRTEGRWNTDEIRQGFLEHLKSLEVRGKCRTVPTGRVSAAIA